MLRAKGIVLKAAARVARMLMAWKKYLASVIGVKTLKDRHFSRHWKMLVWMSWWQQRQVDIYES